MEGIGSTDDFLDAFVRSSSKAVLNKIINNQSESLQNYEDALSALTSALRKGAAINDPDLSLHLERACINFDFEIHTVARNRFEKEISQSIAAEKSLEFLKTDPDGYRKKINEVFSDGIKNLPEGDAYITHARTQIKNLGQARSWMSIPAEIDFLVARQENLKAGIKAFQELQRKALFPPPEPHKR